MEMASDLIIKSEAISRSRETKFPTDWHPGGRSSNS
jgi:hypothetical protein